MSSYYGYKGAGAAVLGSSPGLNSGLGLGSGSGSQTGSGSGSGGSSDTDGQDTESTGSSGPALPYPGFGEISLCYLTQDTRPRNWCLMLITNPWFERVSMLVILLNCVTLGMYQPCVDDQCVTNRCKILQVFDDFIFAFFWLEMTIKMVAMGVYGKSTYLADSWNRLDFFIVVAGALEYCLNVENMNLSAIRTIRVLRPLRAINRIPSMRILVMLLLDTLPMLGNVLLLCFFVFFIFGIVGVQLWEGILRQRCELQLPPNVYRPKDLWDWYRVRVRVNSISFYYEISKEQDYICTTAEDSGMHSCSNFPPYRHGALACNESALPFSNNTPTVSSCVNWNQYYTNCTQRGSNPFQGTISFDNIGLAWVAIFLVISLEGWTDIMYYVQDAHSFWDWIYFVLLIVIGSFFMINLCLVVIATQFAETKKREMERMRQERARFNSTSTLASSTNNSEPATCYAEIVKYIAHLWRRFKRRLIKKIRLYKYRREQQKEARLGETLALSGKPRQHLPCCPRFKLQQQSLQAPPEIEGLEEPPSPRPLLRAASICTSENDFCSQNASGLALLSPPSLGRRRSSVMFSDVVVLHGAECQSASTGVGSSPILPGGERNVCSSEKMTQTGDGNIWDGNQAPVAANTDLGLGDAAMTCQELLALSGALSAALPTGQMALDSFFDSLTKGICKRNTTTVPATNSVSCETQRMSPTNQFIDLEDFSCCGGDIQQLEMGFGSQKKEKKKRSRFSRGTIVFFRSICSVFSCFRRWIKALVEHKYFQQGILLAILINTLSMGIEYHNQPEELTVIVEISNVVFSAIFAVEMLLKVIAEGPFGYISNGFNVFDGVIVILSAFELAQTFMGDREQAGSSGLSVLRTFRLLRILKLVRFMPNLRRQLFVMLRTMDNVAVFFSLLVLFIFIFSILGMNLFGCKFCDHPRGDGEVECDRKNFDSLLWAIVTVFQILTQEDWNVVLFNGMEKTSHWAALYFVALMTFGNYVLFNLLVAILVEGFSSERNERREREQRELAKSKLSAECFSDNNDFPYDESRSISESSDSFTQHEIKNQWRSADDVRKVKDSNGHREKMQKRKRHHCETSCSDKKLKHTKRHNQSMCVLECVEEPKCNIQKESKMLQNVSSSAVIQLPIITTTAATPQDSPNTTLEPGSSYKEFNYNYTLSHSSLLDSLDSIDRSSCTSIPGLLRPPNNFSLTLHSASRAKNVKTSSKPEKDKQNTLEAKLPNGQDKLAIPKSPLSFSAEKLDIISNYAPTQYEKNIQMTKSSLQKEIIAPSSNNVISTCDKSSLLNDKNQISNPEDNQSQNGKCKIQRGYSWKLTRPSLRKKNSNAKSRSGSDSDAVIILNNGRDHSNSTGTLQSNLRKNDSLLQSTNRIQNNTHEDTPNNKSAKGLSPQNSFKGISPQNSVKSKTTTSTASPQISWSAQTSNQQQSLIKSNIPTNFQYINQHNLSKRFAHHRLSLTPDLLTGYQTSSLDHNNEKSFNEAKNQSLQSQPQIHIVSNPKSSNIIISNLSTFDKQENNNSGPLPNIKQIREDINSSNNNHGILVNAKPINENNTGNSKLIEIFKILEPKGCLKEREDFSLYLFSLNNKFRKVCCWIVGRKWFDNVILLFIALNCITLAMERPNIPPTSTERAFLATANYVFTAVFAIEMFVKVVATSMFYGPEAYFTSGWNIMDGSLVIISIIDLLMSLLSESSPRIFGILRVFRLLRSLRPLRVINRAPGLKLVVQTLLSSLRPIGNIVLICCTFFIIFGILGVQLFKGAFFYCEGENIKGVRNKTDCLAIEGNAWINRKYNFDDLGKALMSLFVLSSRDGWVNIMYTGLDAVGVDQQPIVNYSEWRLLYFIAFILLVGFFVLNMFVGVVVENFHRCREEQEKEERVRRAAKRALQMEKKRRKMHEPPYYSNYSQGRLFVHNVVTSKYFDLAIAGVIGLNVVTMAIEYYRMPPALEYTLKIFNYFFTAVFILEAEMKLLALGFKIYLKDKWNQLDVIIVILSIVGIILEELQTNIIPINPTIMRVMRVLRIARVLKLLKMAKGIRALLDTVMQALPQVGNLGLLFFLLFFIFAALGVELFGRLECSDEKPCQGLGEHAHFANFGMAFLTLFRVATGDNWNGIMKDTLREECDNAVDCVKNCCVSTVIAPIFFVIFVLMAQFVLVNVVVAVLMKHLEESHKQMEDEMDMEVELEREMEREQDDQEDQALCLALELESAADRPIRPLKKVNSLPSDFVYSAPSGRNSIQLYGGSPLVSRTALRHIQYHGGRRQTLHAPRLTAALIARSLDHPKGFLSRETSTESYHSRRRLSRDPSMDSYQIRRLLTRDSSTESYHRRSHLTRESSTESYHNRRLRKRMDSITSETFPDKNNSASNVLYEEEPCFIDEDDEKSGERICVVPEIEKDTNKIQTKPIQANTTNDSNEIKLPVKREGSLYKKKYKNGNSSCENTCLLKPEQENAEIKQTTGFLNVPKNNRPSHKMYGSTKHLFKQAAVDNDSLEESSLLLPTTSFESQSNTNPLFLRVDPPTDYLPKPSNKNLPTITPQPLESVKNSLLLQGQSSTEQIQSPSETPLTNNLIDNCSNKQTPTPNIIAVTEDEFAIPVMSEEESVRKIIAERRQIDMMKPENLFSSIPHSTTQVLIESCQSPSEEKPSEIIPGQQKQKNDRHLSADRMSAANFSTSGESGEFLLGQRSSESYEETSDEQGNTNNSASTAIADKTNSINDGDDLDCLIIVCEEKDGNDFEKKGAPSSS